VSEANTLLLSETGIARLADGSEAVNVGPIVTALGFLTEGRGDDRGTDEHGTPLPDLLSLAFDVVQSIILGGRAADYFRQVKRDFDARSELEGRSSLALAKQAAIVRHTAPSSALEKAATQLRGHLQQLDGLALDAEAQAQVSEALQGFRDFGADRWVAATSHLLLALNALEPPLSRSTRARPKTARAASKPRPRTKTKAAIHSKATVEARPKRKAAKARPKKKAAKRSKHR